MASHLLRRGGASQFSSSAAGQQRLRQGAALAVQPCESLATCLTAPCVNCIGVTLSGLLVYVKQAVGSQTSRSCSSGGFKATNEMSAVLGRLQGPRKARGSSEDNDELEGASDGEVGADLDDCEDHEEDMEMNDATSQSLFLKP